MSKRYRVRCDGCRLFIDANGFPSGVAEFKTQKAARAALGTHGHHVSYCPQSCLNFTGKGMLTDDSGRDIKEVDA
jgi:hypothetical protein